MSEAASKTDHAAQGEDTDDEWSTAVICVTACFSLALVHFASTASVFQQIYPNDAARGDMYWLLKSKVWWAGWIVVGFIVIPAISMALLQGHRLRECNLSPRGFFDHLWIYLMLIGVAIPVVILAAQTAAFSSYYPMYSLAGRSWFDLLCWEGLYSAQFIAIEFFFRGFLLGGLARRFGRSSIAVCAMPYMMIHFLKPWPEVAASVLAGFVLGGLAWKTKSIWGGVTVHCAVAYSMDLMALGHKGQLP